MWSNGDLWKSNSVQILNFKFTPLLIDYWLQLVRNLLAVFRSNNRLHLRSGRPTKQPVIGQLPNCTLNGAIRVSPDESLRRLKSNRAPGKINLSAGPSLEVSPFIFSMNLFCFTENRFFNILCRLSKVESLHAKSLESQIKQAGPIIKSRRN